MVAKYGSFTRAGEAMLISQSAVSIQIKKLEEIMGVSLFFRQARSDLTLTGEGEILFSFCKKAFGDLEKTLSDISEETISQIVWKNPLSFFAQSGRLDLEKFEDRPQFDQAKLFEDNSVLRGQEPKSSAELR